MVSIIEKAASHIEDSDASFGDMHVMCEDLAKVWSIITDQNITADQIGSMMIAFKLLKNKHGVYDEETFVDICGYAVMTNEVKKAVVINRPTLVTDQDE